ncbi:MAG: ABC transporter substrate-binding protein [Planctomycetota bacterium]
MQKPVALLLLAFGIGCGENVDSQPNGPQRIIATSGALTEIVYALGRGHEVVGVDSTSRWPDGVRDKPSIGYVRKLSPEGILSLSPSLVISSADAGPPTALTTLEDAGLHIVSVPGERLDRSIPALRERVRGVAKVLGKQDEGERLLGAIDRDLARAKKTVEGRPSVRVLFLFGANPMRLVAAGRSTGAQEIFDLLGVENVCADLERFQPISAESLVEKAPDVILIGLHERGGGVALGEIPGLAETPAGKAGRVALVDPFRALTGSPRIMQAVLEFGELLHPDVEWPTFESTALLAEATRPRG